MSQQDALTKEAELFEAHLEEWRQAHAGKFVLIKNGDVLGFFDSLQEAFNVGTERFGLEPFFVKQIVPKDVVNISFVGKRILAA